MDVTVAPRLARFGAADQRVVERFLVLSGVSIGRRIAAADVAAVQAHPEMDPAVTSLQTLLTAGDLVRNRQDLDALEVLTPWHGFPFSHLSHPQQSLPGRRFPPAGPRFSVAQEIRTFSVALDGETPLSGPS